MVPLKEVTHGGGGHMERKGHTERRSHIRRSHMEVTYGPTKGHGAFANNLRSK